MAVYPIALLMGVAAGLRDGRARRRELGGPLRGGECLMAGAPVARGRERHA
ncbi:hypothetical protein [Caballeronia glathei]|uniref:hypothetical protein n=1 Tax=Caballeronia glathei TaxID=60547 RepID=UPI000B0B78C0|nr:MULTISPECIES: hypothetical protein [Burkholderiaceae]